MDRRRQELVSLRDQDVPPRDGYNVVLTIDGVIQHIVETALTNAVDKHTPISITGIVIRPQNGRNSGDGNACPILIRTIPARHPPTRAADRPISDLMEPGSTFKIVVVSGALNEGVVQLNDTFDCDHGHFAYAGQILHDHEPFDLLTTEGIITKSSNIGAAKIGIRLGDDRLYDYARDFGFGQRTGIPLPGEVNGILYPVSDWSKVSIAQIPMGQGVAVTRLQMAMAMSAIANGGRLMQPMLVNRLVDHDGNVVAQYAPRIARQVMSPATARLMVQALKTVVSPEGTAPDAAMKDYVVAGKTGTAQKAGPGGYLPGKYFASFIGFFPRGQSAALHFRGDGRSEGGLLRRTGLRPDFQGNCRTLRELFEHSVGSEFAGTQFAAAAGGRAAFRNRWPAHITRECWPKIAVETRSLKLVAEACAAEIKRGSGDAIVQRIVTDSRQAQAGDLFFAIQGGRYDGHNFLGEVAARGVAGGRGGTKQDSAGVAGMCGAGGGQCARSAWPAGGGIPAGIRVARHCGWRIQRQDHREGIDCVGVAAKTGDPVERGQFQQ